MQGRFIYVILRRCLFGALLLTAFLFLMGCGSRAEESGLEEFTLSAEADEAEKDAEEESPEESGQESGQKSAPESEKDTVFVYVCGAVNTPGVYEVDRDARVFEALESAGGMTPEASADAVNLARAVVDGEQIYVPTAEEVSQQGAGVGTESIPNGTAQSKVNINTASMEELMTLTGIGEAKE